MRRHTALVTATAVALVLAACSGSDDDGGDTADAPDETPEAEAGDPVTLRMANSYGHLGFTPAVEHFVADVTDRSGGALRIEVIHDYGDDTEGAAEQEVVGAVAAGEVDLAWAGTRVFDTLGVASFQALHAPFLVDSYPLQAAVIDSDIPERMLAGLDEIGVTGLAVLAGGLRIPVGVDAPMLGPDDWAGITFQYYRSDVQEATVTALGATPTDLTGAYRDDGLASGEIHGHEHSLMTYVMRGNYALAPYLALNANMWAETQALFANPDVLSELTDEQVEWLRAAASDAAGRSAELHDVDAGLVVEVCEQGARFAEASEAELGALRDAVESVYAELETDPLTAELIAEIAALKEAVTVDPLTIPDGCTGEAPDREVAAAEGTDDPSVLNGTYQLEWTVDELVAGITELVGAEEPWIRDAAVDNAGTIVLTFTDGSFDQVWTSGQSTGDSCPGTYAVSGERLTMVAAFEGRWDCGADVRGALLVDAAWELTDDELILSDFAVTDEPDDVAWNEMFLGSKPLTKID